MGQYFIIVNLDKKEYVSPHEYDDGIKLTEHCYVNNATVLAVENAIFKGKRWYKNRIVWAGDYMQANAHLTDLQVNFINDVIYPFLIKDRLRHYENVYGPDYLNFYENHGYVPNVNLYDLCDNDTLNRLHHPNKKLVFYRHVPLLSKHFSHREKRYLLNFSKKLYVDLLNLYVPDKVDGDVYVVHPLPILTACGNGGNGGDYYGQDMHLVGAWSGDSIGIVPNASKIPDDFKELKPRFYDC